MNPDKYQKRVIEHIKDPLLIIAGPGSGKTATIIEKLVHMTEIEEINPDNILVITFSNAAAEEIKKRFINRIGNTVNNLHISTFHSAFLFMMKKFFGSEFKYKLIEESKKKQFIFNHMKNLGYGFVISDFLDELIRDIGLYKNQNMDIRSFNPQFCSKEFFTDVYYSYELQKEELFLLDFDDILIMFNELCSNNNSFRIYWQSLYKYIIVDEFQDINLCQFEALRILAYPDNNIIAVGDEDQSIYDFRGSDPSIMLNFTKYFNNSEILYLKNNYRSIKKIVHCSSKLISYNNKRYPKNLHSKNHSKGRLIIKKSKKRAEQSSIIKRFFEDENDSKAIICRTNNQKTYFNELLGSKYPGISIITAHQSKGLEFDKVWIPDVSLNTFPYKHRFSIINIEEERRLFYVAMTRAKKELYITYSSEMKNTAVTKSVFIKEIKALGLLRVYRNKKLWYINNIKRRNHYENRNIWRDF